MDSSTSYVGIDVSKAHLDVTVVPMGEVWRTTNDEQGIAELKERLAAHSPALVVLEAQSTPVEVPDVVEDLPAEGV